MVFKNFLVSIFLLLILTITSCGNMDSAAQTSDQRSAEGAETIRSNRKDESIQAVVEIERTKYTLEDMIDHSDAALFGKYLGSYVENEALVSEFQVEKWLYGATNETQIHIYRGLGTTEIKLDGNSFIRNNGSYKKGQTYLLILERFSTIFTIHDEYVESADLMICPEEGIATIYQDDIQVPDGSELADYIESRFRLRHPPEDDTEQVEYADIYEQVIKQSAFTARIKVNSIAIQNESPNRLSHVYSCKVEEILNSAAEEYKRLKGAEIRILLFKDQAVPGESYIVGASPIDQHSVIYQQTSREALRPLEDLPYFYE